LAGYRNCSDCRHSSRCLFWRDKQKPVPAAEYIPGDADFIAYMDIYKIINDQDFKDICEGIYQKYGDPSWPASIDDALNQLEQDYGIDLYEFSDVTMFAEQSTLETESPYLGLIV